MGNDAYYDDLIEKRKLRRTIELLCHLKRKDCFYHDGENYQILSIGKGYRKKVCCKRLSDGRRFDITMNVE